MERETVDNECEQMTGPRGTEQNEYITGEQHQCNNRAAEQQVTQHKNESQCQPIRMEEMRYLLKIDSIGNRVRDNRQVERANRIRNTMYINRRS